MARMKIQEVMELSGAPHFGLVKLYIKQAAQALETEKYEQLTESKTSIVSGTSKYSMPTDPLSIKSVSVYDSDNEIYKPIPKAVNNQYKVEDNS